MHKKSLAAQHLLYLTYGILPIVAGADKFFNYIVDWSRYLNPMIPTALHMQSHMIVKVAGIIEIAAGFLVLINPILGGSIVALWLVAIAINLIAMGAHAVQGCMRPFTYYDIAIRDLAMAVGAYALVLLSQEKKATNQQIR